MNLAERIEVMQMLKSYLSEDFAPLKAIKKKAFEKNKWFTEEFINLSIKNICEQFLDPEKLKNWTSFYHIDDNISPKTVGVVMAGNIPLVGFHDFLCVFISGHYQHIKLSDKDDVLLTHFIEKMVDWKPKVAGYIKVSSLLKDCDAYIATGSNNSARYFNYYFGKYPSIIRQNKTSVAIIKGNETEEQLSLLADDVQLYFGLGCRNVTKIYVPEGYEFVPMLEAFKKYSYFSDETKYRNNYDYALALLIMNSKFYMTNGTIILVENENPFSPVSQLHYSFYNSYEKVKEEAQQPMVQCVAGADFIPFGQTQEPSLFDYADGVDVMQFLLTL